MLKRGHVYGVFFVVMAAVFACNLSDSKKEKPSFKSVEGVKFIEVRREFDTGFSFSEQGFQQVPEWTLYFLPGDSVKIYSPFEKRYIYYPIYYDHGKVINFAREWLRLIHVSKDSLVLQLLQVQSKQVKKDLSNVYMRFYSENYINDKLHANSDSLRTPNRADTLYIRRLAERANAYPLVSDSLFSARTPVVFKSKIKEITISKLPSSKSDLDYSPSNEYLNPEYTISIRKAYKNFAYSFLAFIDDKGKITVGKFAVSEKDFEEPRRKVLQGITDVYLQRFLDVTPGKTLGIPHATEVMINVTGTTQD